jgi:hypothetical protein
MPVTSTEVVMGQERLCPASCGSHPIPERGPRKQGLGSVLELCCPRWPGGASVPQDPSACCPVPGGPGITQPVSLPGPCLSCFHWPRGVQACARLQQLLEWTKSAGLGAAGERFFRKLSCTLHLLATPSAQLIQVGGCRVWRAPRLCDCHSAWHRGPCRRH